MDIKIGDYIQFAEGASLLYSNKRIGKVIDIMDFGETKMYNIKTTKGDREIFERNVIKNLSEEFRK